MTTAENGHQPLGVRLRSVIGRRKSFLAQQAASDTANAVSTPAAATQVRRQPSSSSLSSPVLKSQPLNDSASSFDDNKNAKTTVAVTSAVSASMGTDRGDGGSNAQLSADDSSSRVSQDQTSLVASKSQQLLSSIRSTKNGMSPFLVATPLLAAHRGFALATGVDILGDNDDDDSRELYQPEESWSQPAVDDEAFLGLESSGDSSDIPVWHYFTTFTEADLDDSHLEVEHIELTAVPSSYVNFLDDADDLLFETCCSNALYEPDIISHNPLYEEEEEIAMNPLYEEDIAVLNPLYEDTRREEDIIELVTKTLLGSDQEEERLRVEEMRKQLNFCDHKDQLGKIRQKCVSGEEIVDWILQRAHEAIIAEIGTLGVVEQVSGNVDHGLLSSSSVDDLSSTMLSPVLSPREMDITVPIDSSISLVVTPPGDDEGYSASPYDSADQTGKLVVDDVVPTTALLKLFSRDNAIKLCQQLLHRFVFQDAVDEFGLKFQDSPLALYRFTEDCQDLAILNSSKYLMFPDTETGQYQPIYERYEPPAAGGIRQVHEQLRRALQDLIDEFAWQNDGQHPTSGDSRYAERFLPKHVQLWDYRMLKDSTLFSALLRVAHQLTKVDPLELEQGAERLSFFINLYNAMYLHGLIRYGRPTNLVTRVRFLQLTVYWVGRFRMSLEDIERIILRSPPRSIHSKALSSNMPVEESRLDSLAACESCDPRIHFALITGSISSPPLLVYEPDSVESQLVWATSNYLQNEKLKFDMDKREITITQMLSWWQEDFGDDIKDRLLWAKPFLDIDAQGKLKLVTDDAAKPFRARFASYNWALNSMQIRWCSPRIIDELHLNNEDQSTLFGASAARKARKGGAKTPRDRRSLSKSMGQHGEIAMIMTEDEMSLELHEVIKNPSYRQFLQRYMELENNAENIQFYNEIERYKAIPSFTERAELADAIFAKYLMPRSDFEINVLGRTVTEIKTMLADPETKGIPHVFDRAVMECEQNMNDIFIRFQQSNEYSQLIRHIYLDMVQPEVAQQDTPSADSGSADSLENTDTDELSNNSADGDSSSGSQGTVPKLKLMDATSASSPTTSAGGVPSLRLPAASSRASVQAGTQRQSVRKSTVRSHSIFGSGGLMQQGKSSSVSPPSIASCAPEGFENVTTWVPPEGQQVPKEFVPK